MSFGSAFALPWEFVLAGFAHVGSGLEMHAYQRSDLEFAFGEGHRSGDDRRLAALVGPVLRQAEWQWPWFDGCAEIFEQAGVWPYRWQHDGLPPGTRFADMSFALRGEYLVITLASAAISARDLATFTDPAVARHFTPTLKVDDERCPAEALMCERHRPAIEAGELNRLPPYFPMCGVHLRINRR